MPLPPPVSNASKVAELIARHALSAVFQAIVSFEDGTIIGYEGLIRGPRGSPFEMPGALFACAAAEGCTVALELAAAKICIEDFARLNCAGKLFLNFSAQALAEIARAPRGSARFVSDCGLPLERLVVELTEQSEIAEIAGFMPIAAALRDAGMSFAIDDYGSANASMNLWVRLQPDIVKIDRFFIHGIAVDPLKFEAVKAMQQFAKASGALLIAEGIETEADLIVVRDMGINYGQGFFFSRPDAQPEHRMPEPVRRAISARRMAVFPEPIRMLVAPPSSSLAAEKMLVSAPGLPLRATSDDALETFTSLPHIHALAVVENERPVALIGRRGFMERLALPYHRELFGKKSCLQFANRAPMMIEKSLTIEQMARLLANDDQSYLVDGFIITENGRYIGLGTGESLVKAVAEVRIEAARYANPLTFLPGNIPVNAHIDRLLKRETSFYACYADLNHFKPFNDQYGYWQGDEILRLAAKVLADVCDPTRDFLGHVGGDDFLILFQSDDWSARSRQAIDTFNAGVQGFYTPAHRAAGGIHGEDRRGNPAFYGFVTMAIGAVRVLPSVLSYRTSEEIAAAAAVAKRRAKQELSGFYLLDAPLPDAVAA